MSGGARVSALYARMMKDRGHDVAVIGLGKPPTSFGKKMLQMIGFEPRWSESPSHYSLEGLEVQLVHGRKTILPEDVPDADVIVASYWLAAEHMFALPDSKGAKVYLVQHHEAEFPHVDQARAAATYSKPCSMLAVSGWLVNVLATQYDRRDVTLVLNAVDTAQFYPASLRCKQVRPTVGFLGSENKTKRIDIAVKACEILRNRFPDLRVRVLAAKPPRAAYVMHDWFEPTYNPPQEKLAEIYAGCDAWLFTSDIEGYGLPLTEALACGTPLVARPAGAAPDLVTPRNGALVDSNDPETIAEAAAKILSLSDDAWKAMSDAALETARQHDWAHSFEKFEAALLKAARSRQESVNSESSGSK